MANISFNFKQFSVFHDKCAMKVGTDGVLIGAWTNVNNANRILDIGTGTGLISLMLAQRNDKALITAIDIDENAVLQAKENIEKSSWNNRINVISCDINRFESSLEFDLIVSNPPYFCDSLKCPDKSRSTARHTDTLNFVDLIRNVSRLLSNNGLFSLIIPFDNAVDVIYNAKQFGLYLTRNTEVMPTPISSPKRSLLEFSKNNIEGIKNEKLVIELSRHNYSQEYINLTKDYYINM